MKKIFIFLVLLIIPILLTGCFNEKEKDTSDHLVWETEGNETGVEIDGKTYALVKIVVTNNSDEEQNIYLRKLCIYDSNNEELACSSIGASYTILAFSYYENERLETTVFRNESIKGYVAFETNSTDIANLIAK